MANKVPLTLKEMAEVGYFVGDMPLIGMVVEHMFYRWDAFWDHEPTPEECAALRDSIVGHEEDCIDDYLTTVDKRRLDDQRRGPCNGQNCND